MYIRSFPITAQHKLSPSNAPQLEKSLKDWRRVRVSKWVVTHEQPHKPANGTCHVEILNLQTFFGSTRAALQIGRSARPGPLYYFF